MATRREAMWETPGGVIIAHAPRERTRGLVRASISRRRGRVVVTRTLGALERRLRGQLTDAVVVDLGVPGEEPLRAATLAREYPSVAFLAMTPLRPTDAPAVAHCATVDVADVMVDGVDDALLRHAIMTRSFSARFAAALETPPPALRLTTPLQVTAWRHVVHRAGRAVRTDELARALDVTREHLSRSFSTGSAANLKRIIDLVRLLAAAELAKNPGYDLRDVARILGYPSSTRLSMAAERLVGVRGRSLAALRAVDLIDRFVRHR